MKKLLLATILMSSVSLFAQNTKYTINDLVKFSSNHYGFVQSDKSLNEYYGDFECASPEDNLFDFNVGCGRGGDIVTLLVKESISKLNTFDLFIRKGDLYYGATALADKKVGEFLIKSESEIVGNIKLCLEKTSNCCGDVGPNFVIKKIKK